MEYIKNLIEGLIYDFNSRDPQVIAENLGIKIKSHPLSKNIKGMAVFDSLEKDKWIIVDSRTNKITKKYILAHELGHAFLHPGAGKYFVEKNTYYINSKLEKEANLFAAELLISDGKLNELVNTYQLFCKIAYELQVPKKLLKIKMNNNNFFE